MKVSIEKEKVIETGIEPEAMEYSITAEEWLAYKKWRWTMGAKIISTICITGLLAYGLHLGGGIMAIIIALCAAAGVWDYDFG